MLAIEDDVQIYDYLFTLMAKSDDDEDNKVTLLDIKENLKDYSLKELKFLTVVLIDTIGELTKDKESLNKNLNKFEEEKVELTKKLSKLHETCKSLFFENDFLNEKLSEMSKFDSKGKSEGSKIQFELEEKLVKASADLTASLERNSELEKDLVRVKDELKKAHKWTISYQVWTSLTSQGSNSRRG